MKQIIFFFIVNLNTFYVMANEDNSSEESYSHVWIIIGFVIFILTVIGFLNETKKDISKLEKGFEEKNIDKILALGNLYFKGEYKYDSTNYETKVNYVEALYCCYFAEALGSPEAIKLKKIFEKKCSSIQINVATSRLKEEFGEDATNAIIQGNIMTEVAEKNKPSYLWSSIIWSIIFFISSIYLSSIGTDKLITIPLFMLGIFSLLYWLRLILFK